MSFYSVWQPLGDRRKEDAQTALVFGFLRHADADAALQPWLRNVIGRDVRPEPLSAESFWPPYRSRMPEKIRTIPELVFRAADNHGPLTVVVEAKRLSRAHDLAQLVREAVDSAWETRTNRLVVVMVGIDAAEGPQRVSWEAAINAGLADRGPAGVTAELRYSSWADLGHAIHAIAGSHDPLSTYAHDVLAKMARHGLLGYTGAPMSDEPNKLTIPQAFALANSAVTQAREFFMKLADDKRLAQIGLVPAWTRPRMQKDGRRAEWLNPDEYDVETTTLLVPFRIPSWAHGEGTFAALYLTSGEEHPYLCSGAYRARADAKELAQSFAWADTVAGSELTIPALRRHLGPLAICGLTKSRTSVTVNWRYAYRQWEPGRPVDDLDWTVGMLEAAMSLWDDARGG